MRRELAGLLSWLVLALPVSAGPVAAPRLPEFGFGRSAGRYVVILNIDALNESVFHELLDAGLLPNIARLLSDKGGQVGRLVSSFPSSTTPAIPEFFHGRFHDRSATLPRKVHAFDRETRQALRYTFKDRDWRDDQIDIWDICRAGGLRTVSFYLHAYDGVEINHFRQKYLAWDSLFEFLKMPRMMNFDRRSLKDAARLFRDAPELPQLAYIWCDTLDVGGHIYGPYSPQYRRGLMAIDRGLGGLFDAMRSRQVAEGGSYYDRAAVVLLGDHGLTPSSRLVDVAGFLQGEGLKLRDTSHVTQFVSEYLRRDWAGHVDAVFVPGGSSVAELYLRPRADGAEARRPVRSPWTRRIGIGELETFVTPRHPEGVDVVRTLASLPGVDLALVKEDDHAVRIVTADRGEALALRSMEPREETYAYVPIDGGDPLGYLRNEQTASLVTGPGDNRMKMFSARMWLLASIGTRYPFAVPRLPRAFGSHPTESDVILVAKPGYDFLARSRGDHGGLDPESMLTPILLAGPSMPRTEGTPVMATVDLLPLLLHLLGIDPPAEFVACLDGAPVPEDYPALWLAEHSACEPSEIER